MRLPFIGGAYAGRSPNVDTQELINWYVEGDPRDTRTPKYLVPAPGTSLFSTAGSGIIRGMYVFNNLLYAVSGNTLYEISTGGTATSRGTLGTSAGPVQFTDNGITQGTQMMIVDGSSSYYTYSGTTLTTKTGGNFTTAATVTFQDGYGIFNQNDTTGRFWLTNTYDFNTIQATNFATAEASPDTLQCVISDSIRLFLLGATTVEVWYDSGDPDFAFTRIPGAVHYRGCAAAQSACRIDSSIIWLGQAQYGKLQIYQMRGENAPEVISTPQIEYTISQYTTFSDAIAFPMLSNGHEFYVLTFPTQGVTWVYDCRTQEWHQRSTNGGRWIANCFAFFNNKFYIGDYSATGKIFELSHSYTDDAGTAITRTMISPHINDQDNRLWINELQIIGNFQAVANASTLTLTYSKDNGLTFPSTQTYTTSSTNNVQRMIFRRLGMSRDWVFQLQTTSNPIIMDAYAGLLYRTEGAPGSPGSAG